MQIWYFLFVFLVKQLLKYNKQSCATSCNSVMAVFCFYMMYWYLYFQVCDEPHPLLIKEMLKSCSTGDIDSAYKTLSHLWQMGYSPQDIISIIFRVCKTMELAEYLKLEFIKVCNCNHFNFIFLFFPFFISKDLFYNVMIHKKKLNV